MKIKINIKSIIFMTIIAIASLLFINISFATNTGKVIVETAKLREQPNTDSKILELTSIGEEVEILEKIDGWYKVTYKRITGYIRSDLIQEENKEENKTENDNEINGNTTSENIIGENVIDETKSQENQSVETNVEPVEDKITEKGKYKISEDIKLKIIPLISAIELDELNKDVEVEVIEILRDWTKIKTQDGKEGWIRIDKLTKLEENKPEEDSQKVSTEIADTTTNNQQTTSASKKMYVNSQIINVRQKADKTSEVIKKITINTEVTVLSTENGWHYVEVDGIKGYISESLLSSTKQETSRSATTTRDSDNTKTIKNKSDDTKSNTNTNITTQTTSGGGNSVVSYAKQFLGCKYVYGGTNTNGFDCSGFTQYVYKHFGVNLNRTAAAQYSNGTSVTSLQPGDLVMFGKSGINHVGIYIGGNTFIHAANKSRGVTTDTLSSGYYKSNYVGARRIF